MNTANTAKKEWNSLEVRKLAKEIRELTKKERREGRVNDRDFEETFEERILKDL